MNYGCILPEVCIINQDCTSLVDFQECKEPDFIQWLPAVHFVETEKMRLSLDLLAVTYLCCK